MSSRYHIAGALPDALPALAVGRGSAVSPGLAIAGDADTGLFSPQSDTLALSTGGIERVRLDGAGCILLNAREAHAIQGVSPLVQQHGTDTGTACRSHTVWRNGAVGGREHLALSRGGAAGVHAAVQPGDAVYSHAYHGSDGTAFQPIASISAVVDGSPAAGSVPGRIVLATTAAGAGAYTEALRVSQNQNVSIGTTVSNRARLHAAHGSGNAVLAETAGNGVSVLAAATSAVYAGNALQIDISRAATNAYSFLYARSGVGGTPDAKFNLSGNGTGYCDGAWTGGGADYAEFFEWADGNPDAEDRRGLTVVLDGPDGGVDGGAKIRPARADDRPSAVLGVVSAAPAMVGDAAWGAWRDKYLRDPYGGYVLEEVQVLTWTAEGTIHAYPVGAVPAGTVVPADAARVVQTRRVLNPAFDPAQPYVPRERRPEWSMVGLLGKLRLRRGQPTGDRWIRLADRGPDVEEWLVR